MPLKAIFSSPPFYAILIAHVSKAYGDYTLLTEMPTYMEEVLHFSLKEVKKPTYICTPIVISLHCYPCMKIGWLSVLTPGQPGVPDRRRVRAMPDTG